MASLVPATNNTPASWIKIFWPCTASFISVTWSLTSLLRCLQIFYGNDISSTATTCPTLLTSWNARVTKTRSAATPTSI
ncbi:hypothetical protein PENTCL1PPCAC_2148 [Pristionchus entomophagus]|uniref:G protein-coupled receptor n=1 Tax=Pristionchus entomophagus TaxID=358040 RepID=A0AAV5SCP8_9BILA|nr:hypothetical protein PENTCL1PPCAC_2148 [Pristionchus entomophagus]